MSLLHGLAVEELPPSKLLVQDPDYPVIVTLRARKRLQDGSCPLGPGMIAFLGSGRCLRQPFQE